MINDKGLTSFRQLQRFPETPVSSLEEQEFQHSNSRKALCTPYCLEMRDHSLSSTEEVSQLSTSTSRGGFPQQYVTEINPELATSSGMDSEIPESKKGRISLQWLECMFVFHLKRRKDVGVPCELPRVRHRSLTHLDTGPQTH